MPFCGPYVWGGGVVYTISGGAGAIKTLGVWRMCVIFRNWLAGGLSDHPQDNLHGHLENYLCIPSICYIQGDDCMRYMGNFIAIRVTPSAWLSISCVGSTLSYS